MAVFSKFITRTPVRLVATPATTGVVMSRALKNDVWHIGVKLDSNGTVTEYAESLLEPNPGPVPAEDIYPESSATV